LIRELHAQRVATVRSQIRIDNATGALVRRTLGWRLDMPEKQRNAIAEAAVAMVKAIEAGTPVDADHAAVAEAVRPFVLTSAEGRKAFDDLEARLRRDVEKLAKTLPVAPWVESVKGFGYLGLAIIVGEAGDLSSYATVAKLWKRMGVAVFNGRSQRKCTNAEEAALQGYNPRRRSALWTINDSLLRQQNAYRDLYQHRRAYELKMHPEFDGGIDKKTGKQKLTMHGDRRARRVAEKRLLRDLWCAWNGRKRFSGENESSEGQKVLVTQR
jgi:hypothetical protein